MSCYPRLVIAGTHSGVGKTTVTLAIMAALRMRGRLVQPFKAWLLNSISGLPGSTPMVRSGRDRRRCLHGRLTVAARLRYETRLTSE